METNKTVSQCFQVCWFALFSSRHRWIRRVAEIPNNAHSPQAFIWIQPFSGQSDRTAKPVRALDFRYPRTDFHPCVTHVFFLKSARSLSIRNNHISTKFSSRLPKISRPSTPSTNSPHTQEKHKTPQVSRKI